MAEAGVDWTLKAERPWDALPALRKLVEASPKDMSLRRNLGLLLTRMGRHEEAEAVYQEALAIDPDDAPTRVALGFNLLGQGRFAEGWPLYAEREKAGFQLMGVPQGLKVPRWQGQALDGKKITIVPEQGLGDQIQFARFVHRLVEARAIVTMVTLPALVDLFRSSFPDVTILPAEGAVKFPDSHYWATLVDLPVVMRAEPDMLPLPPYLKTLSRWADPPEGFKIGISTVGNRSMNPRRSLSEAQGAALRARLPGQLIELDVEESRVQNFAQTAALINAVDLVVSVDTAVAHLAGALNKRCFLMLPGFNPDWRWLREGMETPWYPNHTLYRSELEGFDTAIDRLVVDAQAFAKDPQPPVKEVKRKAPAPVGEPAARGWELGVERVGRVAQENPDDPQAARKYGILLYETNRLKESEAELRRALTLNPEEPAEIEFPLSHNLLMQGRFAEGWRLHRSRIDAKSLNIGFPRNVPRPLWEGEPLAGKHLVILPEQGAGDQIQCARFIPRLVELGARVTVYVAPPLVKLLAFSFPQVDVFPAIGDTAMNDVDYWTTFVDLPYPLGITLDNIPTEPYIRTPRAWANPPAGFRIGFQPAGNPKHSADLMRSLSPGWAAYLHDRLPGQVVRLAPERSGAEDFADTAAALQEIDLVVAVDTSVAHLAGAMGKRTFLLIPGFAPDWRWLRDRDDSPWYPSLTIYRSEADANWKPAIDRLIADAEKLASESGRA